MSESQTSTYRGRITVKANESETIEEDLRGVRVISIGTDGSCVAAGLRMAAGATSITVRYGGTFEAQFIDGASQGSSLTVKVSDDAMFTVSGEMSRVGRLSLGAGAYFYVSDSYTGVGTGANVISVGEGANAGFQTIDFRKAWGRITLGGGAALNAGDIHSLSSLILKCGTGDGYQAKSTASVGTVHARGSAKVSLGAFCQVICSGLLEGKSVKLSLGANSYFDSGSGDLEGISSLAMTSGSVYDDGESGITQGYTTLYGGRLFGTKSSNRYTIGSHCDVNLSEIDFVGGSSNVLSMGAGSSLNIVQNGLGDGSLSHVCRLTLSNGSSSECAGMYVNGGILLSGGGSGAIMSLGRYATLNVGGGIESTSALTISVAAYGQLYAGDVSGLHRLNVVGGVQSQGQSGETVVRTTLSLGMVTGTSRSDGWDISGDSDVTVYGIDFCGGKANSLTVGRGAVLTVSCSAGGTGSVDSVKGLTLQNGTSVSYAQMHIDNDIIFSDGVAAKISVGRFADLSVGGSISAGDGGTFSVTLGVGATFMSGDMTGVLAFSALGGSRSVGKSQISTGSLTGTAKDNSFQFGAYCSVSMGDVNFVGGTRNAMSFGVCSDVTVGSVYAINSLTLLSGTVNREAGGIEYASLTVEGDLIFSGTAKRLPQMTLGNYVRAVVHGNIAQQTSTTSDSSFSIASSSYVLYSAGCAVSVGNRSDLVIWGDFSRCGGISTGTDCRIGINASQYTRYAPRTFEGAIYHILDGKATTSSYSSYPILSTYDTLFDFGDGTTLFNLGTESQIVCFTDFDTELDDNLIYSAKRVSSGSNGWLSAAGDEPEKITETTSFAEYSYTINFYDDLTDFCTLSNVAAGDWETFNGWKVLSADSDSLAVSVHLLTGGAWCEFNVDGANGVFDLAAALSQSQFSSATDYRIEVSIAESLRTNHGGVAAYRVVKS